MKTKNFQALLGAIVLSVLPAISADAGILLGYQNQLQFDNRELVTDADGNGTLSAGDRVQGVLQTNTINTALGAQNPPSPEVTGVFDLTAAFVLAVAGNPDLVAGGTVIANPAASSYDGQALVLFRPTNVTGAEGRLAGFAAGSAVALYEGGPVNVQAALDAAGADPNPVFSAASDGTLVGVFGFAGGGTFDGADYDAPSDWGAAGNGYWVGVVDYEAGVASPFSTFYYGLEVLGGQIALYGSVGLANSQLNVGGHLTSIGTGTGNATDVQANRAGGTTFFDLVGKGAQFPNLAAFGATTTANDQAKFPIFSQDPANLSPHSPEPGSMILALLGAGCAAPFVRRRRQSKEQAA